MNATSNAPSTVDEKKRARREAWSYGFGSLPANVGTNIKSAYHMTFLTEIAGVNPLLIGSVNTLLTIWDAINDIMIGTIADRTNTRFGKYRPHMMWGLISLVIITALMFMVPDFSATGKVAYYIALLFFWSLACTGFVVPWQSLNSAMSTNVDQRNFMLMLRNTLGLAVIAILNMVMPKAIATIPGAAGYQIVMAVGMFICLIGGIICIHGARHKDYKDAIPTPKKVSLKGTLRLLTCRPVICVALMLGFNYLAVGIRSASNIYYFKYVIGDLSPLTIQATFTMIVSFTLVPLVPKLYKKVGRMPVYVTGIVLEMVCFSVNFILRENIPIPVLLGVAFLFNCGLAISNMTVLSFVPDCADYSELHMGSPNAGQISALASFTKKFMNSFTTTIIGVALAIGGYVDASTVTSPELINALVVACYGIPFLLCIAGLIVSRFFPLKGEYAKQMREELNAIRAQKASGSQV